MAGPPSPQYPGSQVQEGGYWPLPATVVIVPTAWAWSGAGTSRASAATAKLSVNHPLAIVFDPEQEMSAVLL
jgi:hypothetical protein